jgi:adenylate cyclase
VLAIVFTDISGSTELRERLGEIEYERLREAHDDLVRDVIEAGDAGKLVKFTGDGALAVFAEPSASVERSLQLQRAMNSHPHFRLRIGIDMGQVSAEKRGGIVKDVFGRHVNRSARIMSRSEPGQVLTSIHVYDAAVGWLRSRTLRWKSLGLVEVEGFAEPISLHEPFDSAIPARHHSPTDGRAAVRRPPRAPGFSESGMDGLAVQTTCADCARRTSRVPAAVAAK